MFKKKMLVAFSKLTYLFNRPPAMLMISLLGNLLV